MSAILAHSLNNPRTRRFLILPLALLSLILLLSYSSSPSYVADRLPSSWQSSNPSQPSDESPKSASKPSRPSRPGKIQLDEKCSTLPGAEDVLVVMKTGSSVIDKRLPIHFTTTFRCTPDFLVFSDVAQDFDGIRVHDSLDELHKYVDMSNPDLKYYQYLQRTAARKTKGWLGRIGEDKEDWSGESDSAWEMDKYKNIPILRKSYAMYPDKKWFVFMDADTAIMWSNILEWTRQLDHTKPFYTGSQNWIGDVEFAHGGSGYIVSQAAAKIISEEDEERAKEHISFAAHECCGDMVLAHAFHDNNIALNGSWPNIQGAKPNMLDFDKEKWCYAAMTFHHVSADQIEDLYKVDRQFSGAKNTTYADIFTTSILPHLTPETPDWDNFSNDILYPPHRSQSDFESNPEDSWSPTATETSYTTSPSGCRAACKAEPRCFQWAYKPNVTSEGQPQGVWAGQCGLRRAISWGEKYEASEEDVEAGRGTVVSGWDLERIEMWSRKHRCSEAIFLTEWNLDGHLEPN